MESVFRLTFRHPWTTVGAWAALCAASVFLLPRLLLDLRSESLVSAGSAAHRALAEARETFGTEPEAAVFVADPLLDSPGKRLLIRHLHARLTELGKVESLASVIDFRDDGGVLSSQAPLADGSAPAATRLRVAAENPTIRGALLSADARSTLLLLTPETATGSIDVVRLKAIADAARSGFATVELLGAAVTKDSVLGQLRHDLGRAFPLAALLLIGVFTVTFGRVAVSLITLLCSCAAILVTSGVLAACGVPVNVISFSLPILILVVGTTEDIHLLYAFAMGRRSHAVADTELLRQTSQHLGSTLLLTTATTVLGFGSAIFSDIPTLQQFGMAAACGMLLRFAACVTLIPAFLRLGGRFLELRLPHAHFRVARRIAACIASRRLPLWSAFTTIAVLLIATLAALPHLRVRSDLDSFLGADSPLRSAQQSAEECLAGLTGLRITLRGAPGVFDTAHGMRALRYITLAAGRREGVDHTLSIAAILSRIYSELRAESGEGLPLPDDDRGIAQLFLLGESAEISTLVSHDRAAASVLLRVRPDGDEALRTLAEEILSDIALLLPGGISANLSGGSLAVSESVDGIVRAQLLSLAAVAGILLLVVSAIFLSLRCALLALLANALPVAFVFLIMTVLRVPLDLGTCMVAAVVLGICVDDTLHLLVQVNRQIRRLRSERLGVQASLRDECIPLTATSLALAGGFATIGWSSFPPVQAFGLISAAALLFAWLVNLVVAPALFASIRIVTLWDMVGLRLRNRLLQSSALFEGFSTWQAKRLILAGGIDGHRSGKAIIRENTEGDQMAVVLSGSLDVEADGRHLTRLEVGDVLGEVSFVSGVRRTATVRTATPVRLFTLNAAKLQSLVRFSPFLASKLLLNISKIMARRLTPHEAGEKGGRSS